MVPMVLTHNKATANKATANKDTANKDTVNKDTANRAITLNRVSANKATILNRVTANKLDTEVTLRLARSKWAATASQKSGRRTSSVKWFSPAQALTSRRVLSTEDTNRSMSH